MSREVAKRVLRVEIEGLRGVLERLDESFDRAVELVFHSPGRVVVTGMGKSGLIGQKIASTLASTGTPSFFVHPGDAAHGDLGMLVKGDVLLALSYSGETPEITHLIPTLKHMGVSILAFTGNTGSKLAKAADVVLDVSVEREACPLNLAPTASTTTAMAVGDALAVALLERHGFKEEDFGRLHPGGSLGKMLLKVEELMHGGDKLPQVARDTPMPDVIYEMSRKGLGLAVVVEAVVEDGAKVAGVITDGDLRRLMEKRKDDALHLTAGEAMNPNPSTIRQDEFAVAALRLMDERKITSVLVLDGEEKLAGVVHIHDFWSTKLF